MYVIHPLWGWSVNVLSFFGTFTGITLVSGIYTGAAPTDCPRGTEISHDGEFYHWDPPGSHLRPLIRWTKLGDRVHEAQQSGFAPPELDHLDPMKRSVIYDDWWSLHHYTICYLTPLRRVLMEVIPKKSFTFVCLSTGGDFTRLFVRKLPCGVWWNSRIGCHFHKGPIIPVKGFIPTWDPMVILRFP